MTQKILFGKYAETNVVKGKEKQKKPT